LPRGRARVIGARARRARLAGTSGLEARAARAAVARPGRAEAPARRLRRRRGGPRSAELGGPVTLGFLGEGAFLTDGRRRSGGAQEPSGGGCDAGPRIVVGGRLFGGGPGGGPGRRETGRGRLRARSGRLGAGSGRLGAGFRLARARDHQARRNGPRGHEVFRIIPAEQAGTLPPFLPRVLRPRPGITVPTRLVTLCTHHRPQSRHTFLANTAVCRSSRFLDQRDGPRLNVTD
jgi:hypothetical protein